jgi:hypothetical protein
MQVAQLEEAQVLHPVEPPATGAEEPSALLEKQAKLDIARLDACWQRGHKASSSAFDSDRKCSKRCWQLGQQYS